MELREIVAREIWGMEQASVETPFEKASEFVHNDLFYIADRILELPELKAALRIKKDYDAAKDLGPSV